MELKKLKTKRLLLVACSGLFLVLMIFLYLAWENPNGGRRAWKYPNNNIFAIPTTSPYTPFSEKVQETPLSVIVGNSYEDEYVRLHRQDLLKKLMGSNMKVI